jgi:hypothetical protein
MTSTAENFSRLYSDVSQSIAHAMADIAELKVDHKDGQQQLSNMMLRLRGIQEGFDQELEFLEEHAEWDRFTMAFFGETNAGKSTIIESLRILFKEESRRKLLEENDQNLASFECALLEHIERVRAGLNKVYAEHAAGIASIRESTRQLSAIVQDEAEARLKIAREDMSARVRRMLALAAAAGLAAGAGAYAIFSMLIGG